MGHLLVVGSYNATLTVFSHELPLRGQTVLGRPARHRSGRKGEQPGDRRVRLGADVTFAVKIGRDYFGTEARRACLPARSCREAPCSRDGLAPASP